jgi:hypothetical protein
MRLRTLISVGLVAGFLGGYSLGPFAESAQATNINAWRAGDNSTITIRGCSLEPHVLSGYDWSITNNLNPTDISTLKYSCGSTTREINVYDGDYGDTTWAAQWYCNFNGGGFPVNVCSWSTIQVNTRAGRVPPSSPVDYPKAIMCHEFGHAVGLSHYSDPDGTTSCIRSPAQSAYRHYLSHDKSHIDGYY